MDLIIYASVENESIEISRDCLKNLIQTRNIEVCQTVDGLGAKLRQARYGNAIAILFSVSRLELMQIRALGDLLRKARIILILPDLETPTVQIGHSLFPRFLTCIDKKPQQIVAVIERMLKRQNATFYH